jgi:predicted lipid-binding transport protein (Tim44 family)
MMYNYKLMRFSCTDVLRLCFCAGACLGGLGGIALGLLERSLIGMLGGMFFGLVVGLISAITGLIYAAVFNVLAPVIGGLAVRLEPVEITDTAAQPAKAAAAAGDGDTVPPPQADG